MKTTVNNMGDMLYLGSIYIVRYWSNGTICFEKIYRWQYSYTCWYTIRKNTMWTLITLLVPCSRQTIALITMFCKLKVWFTATRTSSIVTCGFYRILIRSSGDRNIIHLKSRNFQSFNESNFWTCVVLVQEVT